MRVYEHLWLDDPQQPREYLELILCRDIYHCTPVQLDQIPLHRIMAHLVCANAEADIMKLKRQSH